MKLKLRLSLLLLFPLSFCALAQRSSLNSAEIKQGLESLHVNGRVLYLAAHPDDENTRLLTYLAKEKKVRAAYLSLTRGDGGQNLIGTEQADLLGLLRTQELLAARAIDGAEQFFTRANDFGFSKNPEETFRIWDKQKILSDVVWVIRKFQPQVIITRFPPDARAGHGHHTASAMLAQEAFTAAADPAQFPEQLATVKPWKATRLVWNTFNFGGNNTTANDQLKIDVGGYNALLGKSYGEIAAKSRSQHRSQGFGTAGQRGSSMEYFSHTAGKTAKADLLDDVNLGMTSGSEKDVENLLLKINREYQVSNPAASLPALLALRKKTLDLPFKHQLLDELILACAGLWIETNTAESVYALTSAVPVKLEAMLRSKLDVAVKIRVPSSTEDNQTLLAYNTMTSLNILLPAGQLPITQPYWLLKKHPIGYYVVEGSDLIGTPENVAPSVGVIEVQIGDQTIAVQRPIVYKFTDPAIGEVYQPLVISPPVTASFSETAVVFNGHATKDFAVQLRSFKGDAKGRIKPQVPRGWTVMPTYVDFDLVNKGAMQSLNFKVTPGGKIDTGTFSLDIETGGSIYHQGLKEIVESHIPKQTIFPGAEVKVARADLKLGGKRIGYLGGAGDLVPESLKEIGYEVIQLSVNQVLRQDLNAFDAIITGVRFYNINGAGNQVQPKLLDYVKTGGTLLIQYNVNTPLKLDELGPYPFKLTRDRVTDENAKVTFLAPDHQVLNYPNKITSKDFEGWVQERGLYFAIDLDPRYTPILGMSDPGEQPNKGSLFVAPYGKGKYVYTGLSFFRELPAGVPGAYRLFINLLAKGSE